MRKRSPRNQSPLKTALWVLVELTIYTAFVVAYVFLVLLLLRNWLKHTFDDHKILYAAIVLPLIVAQAVLLDFVVILLRKLGGGKQK